MVHVLNYCSPDGGPQSGAGLSTIVSQSNQSMLMRGLAQHALISALRPVRRAFPLETAFLHIYLFRQQKGVFCKGHGRGTKRFHAHTVIIFLRVGLSP